MKSILKSSSLFLVNNVQIFSGQSYTRGFSLQLLGYILDFQKSLQELCYLLLAPIQVLTRLNYRA